MYIHAVAFCLLNLYEYECALNVIHELVPIGHVYLIFPRIPAHKGGMVGKNNCLVPVISEKNWLYCNLLGNVLILFWHRRCQNVFRDFTGI